MKDHELALFLMLGQLASKEMRSVPGLVPPEPLRISRTMDLAESLPESVNLALEAAEAYKLFFVFENYLRDFVVGVLTENGQVDWWPKVPTDVQDEVTKVADTEEAKSWMSIGSRDKAALLTYPQLLRIMEHCWKGNFDDLVRDKTLIQQARLIGHLRNTICHMTPIPDEEVARVKQTIRDWFRRVAP